MSKIREYNSWIQNVLSMSSKDRVKYRKEIVKLMRESGRKQIADIIESGDCEMVGFAPFAEYVREKEDPRGDGDQLGTPFNHCWATQVIVLWHNKWKCFIHAGPCIEWNQSSFGQPVIGKTG